MSESPHDAQQASPAILDFEQRAGQDPVAPNQTAQQMAKAAHFIARIGVGVGESLALGKLDSYHIAGPSMSCAVQVTIDELDNLSVAGALSLANSEPAALLHRVRQAMR